jgi:hypothetical protein
LPFCVRYATSANHPKLPSNTPIAHARPSHDVDVSGMIEPMITTQVTTAAGLRRMSATPSVKPCLISRRRNAIECSLGACSSWTGGAAGATGWLRAVRNP